MQYKQLMFGDRVNNTVILRTTDNVIIPLVDGNRDYEQYKQWLEEGNTPEPADEQQG